MRIGKCRVSERTEYEQKRGERVGEKRARGREKRAPGQNKRISRM